VRVRIVEEEEEAVEMVFVEKKKAEYEEKKKAEEEEKEKTRVEEKGKAVVVKPP
jgi:hypothetical protein